jgi:sugar phosphate isomerase/epimerase
MPTRFSYQLYSSRNHFPAEKTLKMLAKAGYKEVEGFGGVYSNPKKLRGQMDKLGLAMPSGHFSVDQLAKERKYVVQTASALGIGKLVAPYLMPNDRPKTAKGWRDFGKKLNGLSANYRGEGFSLAWHNHDFEFMALKDGSIPHELIFAEAPLLDWEIDVAWVVKGGANPTKYIKAYAGVITLAHVKDIAPAGQHRDEDGWADVGQGTVKWKEIMAALSHTRCMHFIMEHDNPSDDARFANRSLAAAKKF